MPILGLKWRKITGTPTKGTIELQNAQLAEALSAKLEFSEAEWDSFRINRLTTRHFVKVGDDHFRPVDTSLRAQKKRSSAGGAAAAQPAAALENAPSERDPVEALAAQLAVCGIESNAVDQTHVGPLTHLVADNRTRRGGRDLSDCARILPCYGGIVRTRSQTAVCVHENGKRQPIDLCGRQDAHGYDLAPPQYTRVPAVEILREGLINVPIGFAELQLTRDSRGLAVDRWFILGLPLHVLVHVVALHFWWTSHDRACTTPEAVEALNDDMRKSTQSALSRAFAAVTDALNHWRASLEDLHQEYAGPDSHQRRLLVSSALPIAGKQMEHYRQRREEQLKYDKRVVWAANGPPPTWNDENQRRYERKQLLEQWQQDVPKQPTIGERRLLQAKELIYRSEVDRGHRAVGAAAATFILVSLTTDSELGSAKLISKCFEITQEWHKLGSIAPEEKQTLDIASQIREAAAAQREEAAAPQWFRPRARALLQPIPVHVAAEDEAIYRGMSLAKRDAANSYFDLDTARVADAFLEGAIPRVAPVLMTQWGPDEEERKKCLNRFFADLEDRRVDDRITLFGLLEMSSLKTDTPQRRPHPFRPQDASVDATLLICRRLPGYLMSEVVPLAEHSDATNEPSFCATTFADAHAETMRLPKQVVAHVAMQLLMIALVLVEISAPCEKEVLACERVSFPFTGKNKDNRKSGKTLLMKAPAHYFVRLASALSVHVVPTLARHLDLQKRQDQPPDCIAFLYNAIFTPDRVLYDLRFFDQSVGKGGKEIPLAKRHRAHRYVRGLCEYRVVDSLPEEWEAEPEAKAPESMTVE